MTYIKYNNQYYILATSTLADDRTIVLKDGDTFGVFDRYGDVHPIGQGAQGLYHNGTRYLSRMEIQIQDQRPLMLSSALKEENEMITVDLTNPDYEGPSGIVYEKGSLHIHRSVFIFQNVCYKSIRLCNFGIEPITFKISFLFDADFKDIFEVRGIKRQVQGTIFTPEFSTDVLKITYEGLDKIKRTTRIKFEVAPNNINENLAEYELCLLPKSCEYINLAIACESNNKPVPIKSWEDAHRSIHDYIFQAKQGKTEVITSSGRFNEWIERSKSDLVTMVSETEYGLYPYAGVPWYSTPFGRDGIITAWQCLWVMPDLTKGVLKYLAETQAKDFDDFKDAEPGKIFHEKRDGEMSETGEVPFKMYYGTIDATPLFVCLAGAYLERTFDIITIQEIWPNIEMAIEWIDKYGDIDGDGFVEYIKKSENGLINQGWKDSHDSIFHEDGQLAKGPIALCEVQAYVYDAKIKAAYMARELNKFDYAEKLEKQAAFLKEKFAEKFWSEEKDTYVLALDGEKKQCNIITSNAGHCLFSGIAKLEHARKLAYTLLSEKMFSGWGIRTVASGEARYNPMSYHNGSIWPHDNAMIAYGLARYGFTQEVHSIVGGLFDVSLNVPLHRLPELFCGFDKRKNEGPTSYPVACSPQAWAVTCVYLLLQSCLGIIINSKEKVIYFQNPSLPPFLDEITIANLKVNDASVIIQVRRDVNEIKVQLLNREGDVEIKVINNPEYEERVKVENDAEYK
ncbi:MAG: glycogen debranching N-terminal domain-containing protein [Cytophagaceae bacterium]